MNSIEPPNLLSNGLQASVREVLVFNRDSDQVLILNGLPWLNHFPSTFVVASVDMNGYREWLYP
jgi:hypothetical protein